jgi:glycine cleavage system H protein
MMLAYVFALVCLLLLSLWLIAVAVDAGQVRVRQRAMGLQHLKGFLFHPALFYHPGHTWVRPLRDGTVRVGLDDFGRRLVGGVSKVVLPETGASVRQGEAAVQLRCGKKSAELLSPVDGEVTAVNERLVDEGRPLERDPYGKGWLYAARVPDRRFSTLPTGGEAGKWLERETERLFVFLHDELGMTAADGGELVSKPPRVLSEDQWANLVKAFFAPQKKSLSR